MEHFSKEEYANFKKKISLVQKCNVLEWIIQTFGLRPQKPSVAVAVAEGKKPSASAVDLRPSVDHWN